MMEIPFCTKHPLKGISTTNPQHTFNNKQPESHGGNSANATGHFFRDPVQPSSYCPLVT